MHTLFVVPAYAPSVGGAQTLVERLAACMRADGRPVTVLTTTARRAADFWSPPAQALPPGPTVHRGVAVHRLGLRHPWPAPYRFALLRRLGPWLNRVRVGQTAGGTLLLRHIARWMPPLVALESELEAAVRRACLVYLVDASWDGLFVQAATTAQRLGRPFVAVPLIHTGSPAIQAHFTMPHQVQAYRQAGAVWVLARAEARVLQELGVLPERIHRIPLGVAPPEPPPSDRDVERLRRSHRLDGPWVLFLGAATRDKGAFTLLEAATDLWQAGWTFDLVYAGPQQEALAGAVRALDSPWRDRVRLLGVVDERTKHALLAGAWVLALPSRVDTFGLAVLEAWLHGCPVVVARAGGLAERVHHQVSGLQIPYGQPRALAQALERLLQCPDLARRLGRRGRQEAQRYTWERTYARLRTIEEQIRDARP